VNGNPFPVGEIILRCDFQDATGAKVNEVSVHMFTAVSAKEKKTYKDFDLNFVPKESRIANCAVADANRYFSAPPSRTSTQAKP
jgi:hypothetical protein